VSCGRNQVNGPTRRIDPVDHLHQRRARFRPHAAGACKSGAGHAAPACSPQRRGVETVEGFSMLKRYRILIALAVLVLVLGGLLLFSDPTVSGIGFKYKNF
jgi:hypothetical protein